MIKTFIKVLLLIVFTAAGYNLFMLQTGYAHCQIPCGIYNDYARVQSMLEDADTIEKSAKLIAELAGKPDAQSQNQLVRWVMNKEKHAQNIISTISDYFLTQRVKPDQKDYSERLIKHHTVIITAMKAKQNADVKYVKALRESIQALLSYYPEHTHN
ncbi:MAG: superoxide dismutase, Ni [Pseudomonadota bacterium]